MPYDVVIAGGGFGGLYAARRPERRTLGGLPFGRASAELGRLGRPPDLSDAPSQMVSSR